MSLIKHQKWACLCSLFSTCLYDFILVEGLLKGHTHLLRQESGLGFMEQLVVKTSYGSAMKGVQSAGPQVSRCLQREAGGERLISALKLLQNYLLPCLSP